MKKFVCVLLLVGMAVVLGACGSSGGSDSFDGRWEFVVGSGEIAVSGMYVYEFERGNSTFMSIVETSPGNEQLIVSRGTFVVNEGGMELTRREARTYLNGILETVNDEEMSGQLLFERDGDTITITATGAQYVRVGPVTGQLPELP